MQNGNANTKDGLNDVSHELSVNVYTSTQDLDNEKQRHQVSRTFISDTVTVPTQEMYHYASKASLGDDVFFEPTTDLFEKEVARISGKEAAVFLPSGTMSNQVAIRTHLMQPPYSVLCDHRAHINKWEAGGVAFHSGATLIGIVPANGHHLTLQDIKENVILGSDFHLAPTQVIALENTLNGTIMPQDNVLEICEFAHAHGIIMHLDGARIWHVAAETGIPLKKLCEPFDSVSMCFSKALGAPVGTCLVGRKPFVTKAKWFRKLFGGGMRQTGMLAASAAYALTYNFPKLRTVHALARQLEAGMKEAGLAIVSAAETNMVIVDPTPIGVSVEELVKGAAQLPDPIQLYGARLVVHIQTTEKAVDDLLSFVRELSQRKK